MVAADADSEAKYQVQRARLSAVQARSTSFRGFSEQELDALLPFLSLIEFEYGDPIIRCGEDATWTGVLLGGELEAVLPNGAVIGTVFPGTVVGEMALFRGGKRGCDMRATISGSIAVLKFSDVDTVASESPQLAHKLLLAFAREGYLHTVFPQASPFMRRSKIEGVLGMSDHMVFEPSKEKLSSRGWPQAELTLLFAALEVDSVEQGMTVLLKGRTIEFVIFVLRGGITHGAKRHRVGEIVGASYAISGVPMVDEAVADMDSILGVLTLKRLKQLGDEHPRLAAKVLRLLGVLALGGDLDMVTDVLGGAASSASKALRRRCNASLSVPSSVGSSGAESGTDALSSGAKIHKTVEIVFQRQLAGQVERFVRLESSTSDDLYGL